MAQSSRTFLLLREKIRVINLGESTRNIAQQTNVSRNQVWRILKNKEVIKQQWSQGVRATQKIIHPRVCTYPELDKKIYDWFLMTRQKNLPVSGKLLQEKANTLAEELSCVNFTASNGWLFKFQRRHNIRCANLHGESSEFSERTKYPSFL